MKKGGCIMEKPLEENKKIIIDYKKNKIELADKGMTTKVLSGVYIGENGLTNDKREGDKCTPIGLFNLGFAFGTLEQEFTYPYYKINENQYWVDDPNSPFYNEWVEVTKETKDFPYKYMNTSKEVTWNSAEHLIDYPIQYQLAFVIEYNINPKESNHGSAIFFHVKNNETTAGCVATTLENLLYIINWLGNAKAKILIKS